MRVPVPVSTVAPRISVGGLGAGTYVDEKGARPAAASGAFAAEAGASAGACGCAAQAVDAAAAAAMMMRLRGLTVTFYSNDACGTNPAGFGL